MKLKVFLDNPFEIFWGAILQSLLYFVVGWWVFPPMILSGILWRLGGMDGGSKLFRRIGVPLVTTLPIALDIDNYLLFLAIPFMVWLAPSYGEKSWLFNLAMKISKDNRDIADTIARGITYLWYWSAFIITLLLTERI